MANWEMVITADTNDADYITKTSTISDDDLIKIQPVIEAVKAFQPYTGQHEAGSEWTHSHNWPWGEDAPREDFGEKYPKDIYSHIAPELIDIFQEYLPSGEYGIHTIESIFIYPVPKKIQLL